MDFQLQVSLLSAIAALSVIIIFMVLRPRSPFNSQFILTNVAFLLWNLLDFPGKTYQRQYLVILSQLGFVVFLPSLLRLVLSIIRERDNALQKILRYLYLTGGLYLILLIFLPYRDILLGLIPGLFGIFVYGIILLKVLRRYRTSSMLMERTHLTIVIPAVSLAVLISAFGIIHVFLTGIPSIPNLAGLLVILSLMLPILRKRMLSYREITIMGSKILILSVLVGCIAGVVRVWFSLSSAQYVFSISTATVLLILAYRVLDERLGDFITRTLYREDPHLKRRLYQLSKDILSTFREEELLSLISKTILDTPSVAAASVYRRKKDKSAYKLIVTIGREVSRPSKIDQDNALVAYMIDCGKPVFKEEIIHTLEDSSSIQNNSLLKNSYKSLKELGADLSIPLFFRGEIVGFCTIATTKNYPPYTTEEIDLMSTVANQFATSLESIRIQEDIKQKEKLAAMGEISMGLAHEIRNPLSVIKSSAQYLQHEELAGEKKEFLRMIVEESDMLNRVMVDFLEYSRPHEGEIKFEDLSSLVKDSVKRWKIGEKGKGMRIDLDLEEGLRPIPMDGYQIRQVLWNILSNARASMPKGGTLKISLRGDGVERKAENPADKESGGTAASAIRTLVMEISDTGKGIPPEDQEKVFRPFYSNSPKGTGLGLAIVQRTIERHRGSIYVKSKPGKGTTFIIKLPATAESR